MTKSWLRINPDFADYNFAHFAVYESLLVSDIPCQHLRDACKLESFCPPFRRRVGEYTVLQNIYLYWIYAASNLGNICQLNI